MRTLMVHLGGIGDFLLTCPALRYLSLQGPVTLLGNEGRLRLAVAAGWAESAYSMDAVDFGSVFATPSARFRAFIQPFDRVLLWIRDAGPVEQAFRQIGVRDVRSFPGLPPTDWSRHASAYYLDCLKAPDSAPLSMTLPSHSLSLDVVLHPGSGGAYKNWPVDRYIALANALGNEGRRVFWCRGPAEESQKLPQPGEVLALDSLVELGGALQGARLYVGNDSGITHLAAAVGCPTLALFGPTDPAVWGPRGARVHLLRGIPWPEVETVLEQCREIMGTGQP